MSMSEVFRVFINREIKVTLLPIHPLPQLKRERCRWRCVSSTPRHAPLHATPHPTPRPAPRASMTRHSKSVIPVRTSVWTTLVPRRSRCRRRRGRGRRRRRQASLERLADALSPHRAPRHAPTSDRLSAPCAPLPYRYRGSAGDDDENERVVAAISPRLVRELPPPHRHPRRSRRHQRGRSETPTRRRAPCSPLVAAARL